MTGSENDHRALADLLPLLKEETGIELEIRRWRSMRSSPRRAQELAAPQSAFELIEYLGFLTTGYMKSESFLQLNGFKDDPAATPPDWDFPDFANANLDNVGIFDPATGDRSGRPALRHPRACTAARSCTSTEGPVRGRRPEARRTGTRSKAAAQRSRPDVAGVSFVGRQRLLAGHGHWYTRFITTGGVLMTGSPATKDFMPQLNSPEAVGALQILIDYLPYAPANVTSYGFPENVDGFSSGKIAQMVFWSTIAGPVFDPETSLVADKTGVTLVPAAAGTSTAPSWAAGARASRPTSTRPRRTPPGWHSPGSPTRRPTTSSPRSTRSTPAATPPTSIPNSSQPCPTCPSRARPTQRPSPSRPPSSMTSSA